MAMVVPPTMMFTNGSGMSLHRRAPRWRLGVAAALFVLAAGAARASLSSNSAISNVIAAAKATAGVVAAPSPFVLRTAR
jgi:hypothetical protein